MHVGQQERQTDRSDVQQDQRDRVAKWQACAAPRDGLPAGEREPDDPEERDSDRPWLPRGRSEEPAAWRPRRRRLAGPRLADAR